MDELHYNCRRFVAYGLVLGPINSTIYSMRHVYSMQAHKKKSRSTTINLGQQFKSNNKWTLHFCFSSTWSHAKLVGLYYYMSLQDKPVREMLRFYFQHSRTRHDFVLKVRGSSPNCPSSLLEIRYHKKI